MHALQACCYPKQSETPVALDHASLSEAEETNVDGGRSPSVGKSATSSFHIVRIGGDAHAFTPFPPSRRLRMRAISASSSFFSSSLTTLGGASVVWAGAAVSVASSDLKSFSTSAGASA